MEVGSIAVGDSPATAVAKWKKRGTSAWAKVAGSRQTIRSVSALLGSNVAAAVLSAIGGLLVARFLGPEETGAFRVFTIPLTYLTFLHLGTWDGLWRQIPYYVGKDMPEQVDRLASAAGFFNRTMSLVVSAGFAGCSAYAFIHRDLLGGFGWLSQVFCCWGVFYGGYLTSTYRTLQHFVRLARIQVVQTVLTFGLVFLLPFLRVYGLCVRVALPAMVALWLFERHRPLRVDYRFDSKALKELLSIGLPFSFWGNLYTSVWVATESALVLSLSGVSALGLFSVAVVMRGAVNAVPLAIWQVLTPRVVTAFARDGSVRNASSPMLWVTAGLTGFMVLLAVVGSLLLSLLVPTLIPKYLDGIPLMKVCLWFPVVQAAFLPANALFAAGKTWLYGRSVIAGIAVFALATYWLVPLLGGALAVTVASLLGRLARTLAAYVDLATLRRCAG